MPQALMTGLDEYARGFETHKGSRKLEWMSAVGSIELELELDGVKVAVAVSPAHAAVLSLFTKKGFLLCFFFAANYAYRVCG